MQLIKAVIFGILAYWSQPFCLPQKVLKSIEAICRSYLWSGEATITKKALVSWEKICMPTNAGGYNLINMKIWNHAALCKLLWALSLSKEKMWIHIYYVKKQNLWNMDIPSQASWVKRKILAMRKHKPILGDWSNMEKARKFSIKSANQTLYGRKEKVPWRYITCSNPAPPKTAFIT